MPEPFGIAPGVGLPLQQVARARQHPRVARLQAVTACIVGLWRDRLVLALGMDDGRQVELLLCDQGFQADA